MNVSHFSFTSNQPSRPSSYLPFSALSIEAFTPTPAMNGLTAFAYPSHLPTIGASLRTTEMCHPHVPFELDLSDLVASSCSRLPTSDERSTPLGPVRAAAPVAALASAPPALAAPLALKTAKSSDVTTTDVDVYEMAPGVLSDGRNTARHPAVRAFLANPDVEAAAGLSQPMQALCALAVLHRPAHPAHLLFWARSTKQATAHLVQEVLNMTPAPIQSPVGWMGICENLWFLSNLQHQWRIHDTSVEPTRRALRKRKADGDGEPETEGAPRKRTRMATRATAKEDAAAPAPPAEVSVINSTRTSMEPLPTTVAADTPARPMRPLPSRATSASSDTSTPSADERGTSTAVSESGASDATAVGGNSPLLKLSPHTPALPELVLVEKPASRAPSTRERRPARKLDVAEAGSALGLVGVPLASQELPKKRARATQAPRKPRAKADAPQKQDKPVKAKAARAPAKPRTSKKAALAAAANAASVATSVSA